MKALKKIDDILNLIENEILIISGTAVCLMIMVNAICRYIQVDWFGSEELTLFVAFWLYFIGSVCASRECTHISADMLEMFTKNQTVLFVIAIIKNLIALMMAGLFTYWCFNYVRWQMTLHARSVTYKLPVVIATIPILLAFAFWTLYLIRDLFVAIQNHHAALQKDNEKGGVQ